MYSYRLYLSLILTAFVAAQSIEAQTPMKWEDFVQSMFDEDTDFEDDSYSESYNELYEIHLHPINLNDTQAGVYLKQLPFLTDTQIEAIIYYVAHNKPMRSLGELMLIRELDYTTRMRLMLFCYAGELPKTDTLSLLQQITRNIKHEATLQTKIPFYIKEGFRDVADSVLARNPNKVYQGTNGYYSMRYQIRSTDMLRAGIQLEKDAGEKNVDYISAWAIAHNLGRTRTLAVGDYRASFGQGLVVNMGGMSFGKQSAIGSIEYRNQGFLPHSSVTESGYMRGIAADITISEPLHVATFVSYIDVDATRRDTTSAISSLKTDGLHRTMLERSKRGMVHNLTVGANIQYQYNSFQAGLTAIHTNLSMPLAPQNDTPSTAYRRYYLSGKEFGAIGLSYGWHSSRWSINGETATTTNTTSIASTNFVKYKYSATTNWMLNVRHFSKDYATLYGRTLSENSQPQNETGIMVGVKTEPFSRLYVETYADVFHFPFSTYRATGASNGADIMAMLTWKASERSAFQLRYRLKTKQQDCVVGNNKAELYYATTQNLRLTHNWQPNEQLSMHTMAACNFRFNPDSPNETGFLLSERARWDKSNYLRFETSATYFHTDSYGSRLFAYEPTPLYSMGMTSYYYHGFRFVVQTIAKINANLSLYCKFASTRYFDHDTIGTGLELIPQSHREDLMLQLRWVMR